MSFGVKKIFKNVFVIFLLFKFQEFTLLVVELVKHDHDVSYEHDQNLQEYHTTCCKKRFYQFKGVSKM